MSDDADRFEVTGARAKGVVRKAARRMLGVVMEMVTSPLQRHSPDCLIFNMLLRFSGDFFLISCCSVNNDGRLSKRVLVAEGGGCAAGRTPSHSDCGSVPWSQDAEGRNTKVSHRHSSRSRNYEKPSRSQAHVPHTVGIKGSQGDST